MSHRIFYLDQTVSTLIGKTTSDSHESPESIFKIAQKIGFSLLPWQNRNYPKYCKNTKTRGILWPNYYS